MKPIDFPESTLVYAKNQKQYRSLPAHKTADGIVISCWSMTWRERLAVLFKGRIWSLVSTFNQPLQPMILQEKKPFSKTKGVKD